MFLKFWTDLQNHRLSPRATGKISDATGLPRGGSRSLLPHDQNQISRCHGLAPWSFHDHCYLTTKPDFEMPRACPVELHDHRYLTTKPDFEMPRACPVELSRSPLPHDQNRISRCHGLAPWSFHDHRYLTIKTDFEMPRACPVELSRSPLPHDQNRFRDATGLPRGAFTITATSRSKQISRCHGLAPWSFTITATSRSKQISRCHGLAPWSFHARSYIAENVNLQRDKPVASKRGFLSWRVADIHGTRPWHPNR